MSAQNHRPSLLLQFSNYCCDKYSHVRFPDLASNGGGRSQARWCFTDIALKDSTSETQEGSSSESPPDVEKGTKDVSSSASNNESKKEPLLGTLSGAMLPCVQNILGVLPHLQLSCFAHCHQRRRDSVVSDLFASEGTSRNSRSEDTIYTRQLSQHYSTTAPCV